MCGRHEHRPTCLLVSYEAQEWGEVGLKKLVDVGHERWAQPCGDVPMEGLEQRSRGSWGWCLLRYILVCIQASSWAMGLPSSAIGPLLSIKLVREEVFRCGCSKWGSL